MAEGKPAVEGGNLWTHKPWWCQPWSIVGTGVALVGGSWWWLRLWWISLPLASAVLLWWWLFLVLVPAAYVAQGSEHSGTGTGISTGNGSDPG